MSENKKLDEAIARVEKKFGKRSIMRLNSKEKTKVDTISTGSLELDIALGVKGLPRGRVIEIFGQESSGKTTLTLSIIAEAQKKGIAVFIDAEHAFDPDYAKLNGVNLDDLLISQPDTGEEALDIAETMIKSGEIDLIVVDSVASLVPKAEVEGEMGDAHIALQARLMSHALRKICSVIGKSKTCLVFVNQIREKVGIVFGNPEVTPGGRALKFYSSVRIELRKTTLREKDIPVGIKAKATVVKNKVAAPFHKAEFDIYFNEGLSKISDIINLAITHEIIKKSGAWYSYKDANIAQGKEQLRNLLKEDEILFTKIEKQVHKILGV